MGVSVGEPVSDGEGVAVTVGVGGPPVGAHVSLGETVTLGVGVGLGRCRVWVGDGVGVGATCLCGFLALWVWLWVGTTAGAVADGAWLVAFAGVLWVV